MTFTSVLTDICAVVCSAGFVIDSWRYKAEFRRGNYERAKCLVGEAQISAMLIIAVLIIRLSVIRA